MKPMTLRLPDELAEVIERGARHERRSIHAHILWLLEGATTLQVPDNVQELVVNIPPQVSSEMKVIQGGNLCTCGPGEKAKGKHNRWCPMRGK